METDFSISNINEEEGLNDDEKSFIQGLCIESHTRFCSKITKVLSKGSFTKKNLKWPTVVIFLKLQNCSVAMWLDIAEIAS